MSASGMATSGEIPADAFWATPGTSPSSDEAVGVCREVGAARSSEEAPVTGAEPRGRRWFDVRQRSEGPVMACPL